MKNFIPKSHTKTHRTHGERQYINAMGKMDSGSRLSDRGDPGKRLRSNLATCRGKLKYCPKRAKSLAKKYRSGERFDETGRGQYMTAYACSCCGTWHIGHNHRKH